MALNANNVPSNNKRTDFPVLAPGSYPARLVAVVDMGLQPQREYKGEEKPPARELAITFEFVDEFMTDEDGKPDPTKPRWLTRSFPFYNLASEKAISTKWYKALDPDIKHGGDWAALIDTPVMATVTNSITTSGKNKGRVWENLAGVSLPRPKDAEKMDPLVNKPIVFDLDNPDMEAFKRLPKWMQDKIKSNLEYEGSALQKLAGKDTTPAKKEDKPAKPSKKEEVEDDDIPY